ncbi:MAG: response regulator [Vicinamibacterales bacterium]|jgi:PAS domain S-box-containing protein
MALGITSRIVVIFLLFAATLLTVVGVLSYRSGSASLESAAVGEVLSLAIEKEAALDAAINERLNDLGQLAAGGDLVTRVASLAAAMPLSGEARSIHGLLLQELAPFTSGPHAAFLDVSVIEPQGGIVVASTAPAEEGTSKLARPYFISGKVAVHLQGPYYSTTLKGPAMVVSAPVRSAEGRLLAVLTGRMDLAALNAIAQRRTGRHQSEDSFLFNGDRLLITQPRFIKEAAVLRREIDTLTVRRCIESGSGVSRAHDYRGVPVVEACHWVDRYQLGLVVKIDQAEAFASVRAFEWALVQIGALALLGSAALAFLVARRIVRPLRALRRSVASVAAGRFNEPIPDSSNDDIGLVAREFNGMARAIGAKEDELRQVAVELDERVRQRTAELARAQAVAQVGSWEWDVVANAMTWSDQTFLIFGVDREHCIPSYEQYLACLHPDDRRRMVEWVNSVLATKTHASLDNRIVRPDGEVRFVHGSVEALLDGAGNVTRLAGTIQDVTTRKNSDEQFKRLLEAAPDAMVIVDRDGQIVLVNSQTEQLFGYSRAELLGRSVEVLIPARFTGHIARRNSFAASSSARRMGAKRSLFASRKDGSEIPVEISLSPLETTDGAVVISAIRDVTEAKRAEAELLQAKAEAEAANRAKSEFLATMSHEIRTPMNGVIGAVGLLMDGDLTARQRELATIARSSAHSLLTLINDILDISKIEAGRMPIEEAPFDLLTTVEEVGGMFAERAQQKGLELVLRYAPDARRRFHGDASRIRQVLVNLVGNAIKFSEHGHVLVSVEEEPQAARQARAGLRVSIEDSGIGITPEAVSRLFERFSQADASTTRRFGGTGLGLAICKRLVELMGGQIGVDSRIGEGSKFWFTLPLPVEASPVPAPLGVDITAARVLLVDDNAISRRVVYEQLCGWRIPSSAAASVEQALAELHAAAAAGDSYQIVLIDHHLPGMDGIGLARTIKADPLLREAALILLTTTIEKNAAELTRVGGFAGSLVKPMRPSALFDVLIAVRAGQVGAGQAPGAARPAANAVPGRPRFHGRVLVADDNTTNQRVAQLALEGLGCQVELAGNGAEAVKLLQQQPYDLVFMDGEMPVMDGFEATRAFRALEARLGESARPRPRVPIIAMTAKVLAGDREKCLAAGMDDYMSKPVQLQALVETLDRWLSSGPRPGSGSPAAMSQEAERPAPPPRDALDPAVIEQLRTLAQQTTPSLFGRVMQAFLEDAPKYLTDLRASAGRQDPVALGRAAHALKGASLNVGAATMAPICGRLEAAGCAEDLADVTPLLVRLDSEFQRVQTEIARELNQDSHQ